MAVMYDMSRIDAMEGHEFEHFIATLLCKLGYENVEVTRGSGDQGVDVLAEKEGVRYAVQCKCYSSDLGNTPVQEVNTGKVIYHCHVGVVVTNRYFTQGAKEAAKATGVLLWDRSKLTALLAQAQMEIDTEISAPQREENLTLWNGNPLLRRGGIALKDREWKKARQFFDRVLNTDPENAEAYLGLVMAEAELSDQYEFRRTYIYDPMRLHRSNQNNLRHAKEFASRKLRAWFTELEIQQKDVEVQQEDEADKRLTRAQERYKMHNHVIELVLIYLSENPERAVTPHDMMEKVLRPGYPGECWDEMKAMSLLNALCDKGNILIRIKDNSGNDAFMANEAEHHRQKAKDIISDYLAGNFELAVALHDIMDTEQLTMAQERNEEYKQVIMAYLSASPELVVTPSYILEKVLRPAYLCEIWSNMKVRVLLNHLCDSDKLTRVKDNSGNDAFMISEAKHRQLKAQEVILAYLFANPGLAVTAHDLMEKVLMSAYPDEPWSDTKAENLLNALCDGEGKIIYVKDNNGNGAFIITEAERRQLEQAEAERRCQEEERTKKRAVLGTEQAALRTELANLKGLFTGRRRREIEARLAEIETELK